MWLRKTGNFLLKTILGVLIVGILIISLLYINHLYERSQQADRIKMSKHFKDGKFQNSIPTRMIAKGRFWEMVKKSILGRQKPKKPARPLPIVSLNKENFHNPPSVTPLLAWLGHSSVLIELHGKRFLFDPVFSQRASFVQWIGPKRFHPTPLNAKIVPPLDGVIISHDHYDHLDKNTVLKIADRTRRFYVPLGIGHILESWGITKEKIRECDWWDELMDGEIRLVCTPARHYSGRRLFGRDGTLWCSWVIMGKKYRIYFSGDTGMLPEFQRIGDQYGPFHVTFIKIGAYDVIWPDIHINPEEAVRAQIQLRGQRLIPTHWGTFNLGLHSWYEPVERLLAAAERDNTRVSIPMPGEIITPTNPEKDTYWWKPFR